MTAVLTYDAPDAYDTADTFDGATGAALGWIQLDDGDDRIVFNTGAESDGLEWWASALNGWDSPDVRSASTPRPQDDGLFLPASRHGGRELELVGKIVAASRDAAYAAKIRLAKLANLRKTLNLYVAEDRVRLVTVTRTDRLLLAQRSRVVDFSIPLIAGDPRKYASSPTVIDGEVGEDLVFENDGTIPTRPVAVVTGPVDVPALINVTTGEELVFDVTLDAGDELEVDFDLRTARSAGASFRAYLASGYRWWELAPGSSTIRLDADTSGPGAGVTFTARSAWI